MFFTLFSLEIKAFFRSANLGKSLLVRGLMLFLFIYFSIAIILISASIYYILKEQFPDKNPMDIANRYVIYYFGFEFLIRFFLQTIPVVKLKPLLIQNIRKSQISHFLMSKSLFSIFNLLPLFMFTPFAITLLMNGVPGFEVGVWWWALIMISLFLNFFSLYIQKIFTQSNLFFIILFIVYGTIYGLQYFNIIDIPQFFGQYFNLLQKQPIWVLIPILGVVIMYVIDYFHYKNEFYIEDTNPSNDTQYSSSNYNWLSYFGNYAPYIQNDIRLILRNKRSKSLIYISLFMLLYGLIFIFNDTYTQNGVGLKLGLYLFLGILMSGMFAINFGQMVPAWDSRSYGLFSTLPFSTYNYLFSKALFMSISIFVLSPFMFLYCIIDRDIFMPFLTGIAFNIGFTNPFILFLSYINKKPIDLDKNPMMNYQGVGWSHYVGVLVILLIALGFYFLMLTIVEPYISLLIILLISIILALSTPIWLRKTVQLYTQTKYKRIEGFKK